MKKLKIKIHPLFIVFGLFYAVTGKIFLFLVYTLVALIHESGHYFMAEKLGYRLNNIVLMPFGAIINGNVEGLKVKDEILVAILGPVFNLITAIIFVALWWIVPELYAFTDIAVFASLALFIINFLPAYPLDGGRIFSCLLKIKLSKGTADKIVKITGAVTGVIFLAAFIVSCFNSFNISLLFFGIFILLGVFNKKQNAYVKMYLNLNNEALKRGITIKRIAVSDEITVKKLINLIDEDGFNEVTVYSNGKKVRQLNQNELTKIIENNSIYALLKDVT